MRDGSRRFPQTSTYSAVLGNACQRAGSISPTGLSPPMVPRSSGFGYQTGFLLSELIANCSANAPQHRRYRGRALDVPSGLGSFPFARHYSGNRCYFIFLGVLRYFNSPRWLHRTYEFSAGFPGMTPEGFPHSDIAGSEVVSTYPTLIAGCHVLHRLSVPRHPPYAFSNLTVISRDQDFLSQMHHYNNG